MANWKAVQATGQLKRKQANKVLSKSLKTSFGLVMRLLMIGLPGDSKADED